MGIIRTWLTLVFAGWVASAAVSVHAELGAVQIEMGPDGHPRTSTIDNDILQATVDASKNTLTLTRSHGKGPSATISLPDAHFNMDAAAKGRLEFRNSDDSTFSVTLKPKSPFAFIHTSLHTYIDKPREIDNVTTARLNIDLGRAPAAFSILGCDGLTTGDKERASYTFLAGADPTTRSGFVGGWITSEKASGVVLSHAEGTGLAIEARSEYGKLRLPGGTTADGETFAFGFFDDSLLGLEAFADAVAKANAITLKPMPSGYCTWYSGKHGGASDQKALAELSEFCSTELTRFGFGVVQIDDGWQISSRDFSDFNPKGKYADGMKPTADKIRSLGMTAGIWLIPFGWDPKRPEFAEHQDWFVHRADGSLYEVKWAGTCLDMTHPGARAFLKGVVARICGDWGYKYIKVDGLWTGMATQILYPAPTYRPDDLGGAVFHDPSMTNIAAYRAGLRLVREAGGDDVFIAGCNIAQNLRTLGASMGVVDSMRIGADIAAKWEKILPDMRMGSRLYFLQGRVWHNDPDCLMVRSPLTLDQARAWGSWIAVSGQMNVVSEWLPGLDADRLDIVKRSMPGSGVCGRPIDLFSKADPQIWHASAGKGANRRDVIGLFNWDEKKAQSVSAELSRIPLPANGAGSYVGFDYWENQFVAPFTGTLKTELRPGSCHVISLRPVADHPQVVGTSRHITQGIIDLSEEKWDGATNSLQGQSLVVGGDPYEIRIATPSGPKTTLKDIHVSPEDEQAGVTVKIGDAGPNVRIAVVSKKSRTVRWVARFE